MKITRVAGGEMVAPASAAWLLASVLACGFEGEGGGRAASYQVLTLTIAPLVPEQPFKPGHELMYELTYRGDLANEPKFAAVFTHQESGAVVRRSFGATSGQNGVHLIKQRWFVRDDFLKKTGHFQLQMEASITATRKGSSPWVVLSNPIVIDLKPTITAVRVLTPAIDAPIPYATPLSIQIEGQDLWDAVRLTAIDAAGAAIPGLENTVPFASGQATGKLPWTIRARTLEKVGTHEVRLVAAFGEAFGQSAPLRFLLTHTIDEVTLWVRNPEGLLAAATAAEVMLPAAKELVIRGRGTQLAGHEVTVNGGSPFVAMADEFELVRVPGTSAFADGKGTHDFSYTLASGGVERTAGVVLKRWGILNCGWDAADGRRLKDTEVVEPGTVVTMRASTWGFPDTETTLGVFKDREATFEIWESDSGRHVLLGPGDDDVDEFDADIKGNATEKNWTARFVEDLAAPLIGELGIFGHAELFFNVKIEDQSCTSDQISVPSGPEPSRP